MEFGGRMWGLLWVVVLVLVLMNGCYGYSREEERVALLQLKASINHPNGTSLPSWVEDTTESFDYCHWERIECNNSTGRVIQLSLNHTRDWKLGDQYWYLNASLFLPFQELKILYLRGNTLAGWFENEGSERLSLSLSNMEVLDLTYNQLNNSILSSLVGFSSLKFLSLASNELKGLIHIEDLDALTNLEKLDLSSNMIESFATPKGNSERMSPRLSSLEIIDLGNNRLINSGLSFLGGLSSLKYLYLGGNELRGSIHIKDLDALTNLEELDLSFNMIESFATPKGSERMSPRLSSLKILYLEHNNFINSSLSSLSGLSSLKHLYLSDNQLQGSIHIRDLDALTNLEELDLTYNMIESFANPKGSERLSSSLSNLEVLDLGTNYLNNSILSSLGGFSSLKFLTLSWNNLKGLIRIEDLDALEELDLTYNMIESFANPKGYKSFSKLKILHLDHNEVNTSILQHSLGAFSSLKSLSLQYNTLNGTINSQDLHDLSNLEELVLDSSSLNKNFLQGIGVMTSLKFISLTDCGLNGTLPPKGWCELKSLRELYLRGNGFQELLPSCLGNLTSLRVLDLSHNQFTGNIAFSPLSNLTSLEFISLSNNNFQVPISFRSFANHSNLKFILSDSNKLVADSELQTRVPKFQLKVFRLSNCTHIDLELSGAPPNFLFYQKDLRVVVLSHSNFRGKFPGWLLQNNTKLEGLYLRNNSFVGPLQLPSHPNPNILKIDISNNNIGGQIPTNFSRIFSNLSTFNMSRNVFEGSIPSSFGDMKSLSSLDLSNNNLTGGIPEHLAMGCSSLKFLMLSNNNLHGQMFPKHANLANFIFLYLNGNNFVGEIPDSLSNNNQMTILDISSNHLSGKLPIWIGNLSGLEVIDLSRNHFEGPIPLEFCKLDRLVFMDLSKNNLSGFIPSCFNPSAITHVHLNNNKLRGPMTHAFNNSSSLVTLDLSENNLNGSIPNWIGTLSALSILLLKANHFEGEIPIQICLLMELSVMDLSRNNLSGTIPPCLSNITFEATEEKSHVRSNIGNNFDDPYFLIMANILTTWGFLGGSELEIYYRNYLDPMYNVEEQMEFTTKRMTYSYKGHVLEFMSGIDLSCNQLTGEIPPEIGSLSTIHMLNLSHNNLSESIPATFSNLCQIESLDLSYNLLNGTIPRQLTELYSLEVFSVAHNNLEGATPDRKAQFATFEESSYEGNPLLCGPPLNKSCPGARSPSPVPSASSNAEEEDGSFIDMNVFYVSFIVSYVIVLLGIAAVLYINPYWRRTWFNFIEVGMASCYYFVLDNFLVCLSILRHHV